MMKLKDLEGSHPKTEKEDGARDPHLSQKPTMTKGTTNSSHSCHKLLPTPWDDEQESWRHPLPCSKMKNSKISACGC